MTTHLFILHDQHGTTFSIMQAYSLTEDKDQPYGGLEEGEAVIEVELTAVLEALVPHEIMEQYSGDPRTKQLKKKE